MRSREERERMRREANPIEHILKTSSTMGSQATIKIRLFDIYNGLSELLD